MNISTTSGHVRMLNVLKELGISQYQLERYSRRLKFDIIIDKSHGKNYVRKYITEEDFLKLKEYVEEVRKLFKEKKKSETDGSIDIEERIKIASEFKRKNPNVHLYFCKELE